MRKPSKSAIAAFMDFHGSDEASRAWAEAKLKSGTAALTPEAVSFYQGAISERKAQKAREEAAAKSAEESGG